MQTTPDISIIICTQNRAASLAQTLAAIGQVHIPADVAVELVAVDNGSSDHTADVVRRASLANMPVRYVLERQTGQVYARNRGLQESSGGIVLFTDDDVRPPLNWIEGMCGRILLGEADAVAGGVRMAPHLDRPWMTRVIRQWMACTEGIDPARPQRFVGANMAFARKVLEKVPAFDPELGPGALGFFDETLFSAQLIGAGYRIVSAFDVAVEHHFDAARLDPASLREAARRFGRSHAYMFYHWEHKRLTLPVLHLLRERLRLEWRKLANLFRSSPGEPVPACHLDAVRRVWFVRQYLSELGREPKYERHGLAKRG